MIIEADAILKATTGSIEIVADFGKADPAATVGHLTITHATLWRPRTCSPRRRAT